MFYLSTAGGNTRVRWKQSRDPRLHGRTPVFRSARTLILSYVDPYVDMTGQITGYAVVDLLVLGRYDWRLSKHNVWKAKRLLQDTRHRQIRSFDRRIDHLRRRFKDSQRRCPDQKPMY
jgi:hypothetical protein